MHSGEISQSKYPDKGIDSFFIQKAFFYFLKNFKTLPRYFLLLIFVGWLHQVCFVRIKPYWSNHPCSLFPPSNLRRLPWFSQKLKKNTGSKVTPVSSSKNSTYNFVYTQRHFSLWHLCLPKNIFLLKSSHENVWSTFKDLSLWDYSHLTTRHWN